MAATQIRLPENIGALTSAANTVSLASSRVNIGALQYYFASPISLNATSLGAGGLDVGGLQANKLYCVYAVLSSGSPTLVASLSPTAPAGFAAYRLVGYFDTNGTPSVQAAASQMFGHVGDIISSRATESQFRAAKGPGWVLFDNRNIAGSAYATQYGVSNLEDARAAVLRGKNNGRVDGQQNPDGDLALGAFQNDQLQGHFHSMVVWNDASNPLISTASYAPYYASPGSGAAQTWTEAGGQGVKSPKSDGVNGTPRSGSETRMKNLTVNHFVKIN